MISTAGSMPRADSWNDLSISSRLLVLAKVPVHGLINLCIAWFMMTPFLFSPIVRAEETSFPAQREQFLHLPSVPGVRTYRGALVGLDWMYYAIVPPRTVRDPSMFDLTVTLSPAEEEDPNACRGEFLQIDLLRNEKPVVESPTMEPAFFSSNILWDLLLNLYQSSIYCYNEAHVSYSVKSTSSEDVWWLLIQTRGLGYRGESDVDAQDTEPPVQADEDTTSDPEITVPMSDRTHREPAYKHYRDHPFSLPGALLNSTRCEYEIHIRTRYQKEFTFMVLILTLTATPLVILYIVKIVKQVRLPLLASVQPITSVSITVFLLQPSECVANNVTKVLKAFHSMFARGCRRAYAKLRHRLRLHHTRADPRMHNPNSRKTHRGACRVKQKEKTLSRNKILEEGGDKEVLSYNINELDPDDQISNKERTQQTGSVSHVYFVSDPESTDSLTLVESNSEDDALNKNEEDSRHCRICLESDNEDDLIQPCKCAGTAADIHRECLDRWRWESFLHGSNQNVSHCEICLAPFELQSYYLYEKLGLSTVLVLRVEVFLGHFLVWCLLYLGFLTILVLLCGYLSSYVFAPGSCQVDWQRRRVTHLTEGEHYLTGTLTYLG